MRGALLAAVALAAGCGTGGRDDGAGPGGFAPPPAAGRAGADPAAKLPRTLQKRYDGRTAEEWGRDLLDLDPGVGFGASSALRRLGDEGLRFVLAGLRSPDAAVRNNAVFALDHGAASRYPDVFLPALTPLLADGVVSTRVAAAKAVAGCGFRGGVPALRGALAGEKDEGARNTLRDAVAALEAGR